MEARSSRGRQCRFQRKPASGMALEGSNRSLRLPSAAYWRGTDRKASLRRCSGHSRQNHHYLPCRLCLDRGRGKPRIPCGRSPLGSSFRKRTRGIRCSLRHRGRRIRFRLFRQAKQIHSLSPPHSRAEQPGVRPQ